MKTRKILFGFLVLLIISEVSCKKVPVIDYRDVYCGTFNFTIIEMEWMIWATPNYTFDTSWYKGEISKLAGTDSMLFIRYFSGPNYGFCNGDSVWGSWIKPTLYPNGILKYPQDFCSREPLHGTFFTNDSVRFRWCWGGNGSNTTYIITGVRK
jgi:hypothetical protein